MSISTSANNSPSTFFIVIIFFLQSCVGWQSRREKENNPRRSIIMNEYNHSIRDSIWFGSILFGGKLIFSGTYSSRSHGGIASDFVAYIRFRYKCEEVAEEHWMRTMPPGPSDRMQNKN